MVLVPGSSGDSRFHRESLSEDVKIKTEPGMETSKANESLQTHKSERYLVYQSSGRVSSDKKIEEENRSLNLGKSLRLPPEVPSISIADCVTKHDTQSENPSV